MKVIITDMTLFKISPMVIYCTMNVGGAKIYESPQVPFQIPFRMKFPTKFHTKSSLKWHYGGNFICNDLRSAISEIISYYIRNFLWSNLRNSTSETISYVMNESPVGFPKNWHPSIFFSFWYSCILDDLALPGCLYCSDRFRQLSDYFL